MLLGPTSSKHAIMSGISSSVNAHPYKLLKRTMYTAVHRTRHATTGKLERFETWHMVGQMSILAPVKHVSIFCRPPDGCETRSKMIISSGRLRCQHMPTGRGEHEVWFTPTHPSHLGQTRKTFGCQTNMVVVSCAIDQIVKSCRSLNPTATRVDRVPLYCTYC